MGKCDNCEKLKALQAKYERLEIKYNRLLDGEPVRKMHFDLDGENTACGKNHWDNCLDATENIKEVTCGSCRIKWRSMKAKWEREQKAEQRRNAKRNI